MGVYIKGMEMPKSCGNCFFDTHCDNWRLRNWGAPPPDDCPLVEVPPHGRLIDADALVMENYEQYGAIDALALEAIKAAPTVIEAEEGE